MSKPFIIGIAGGTGSGKTTVAEKITSAIPPEKVLYITHDHYYKDQSHLPPNKRLQTNYDHPNSLESELLAHHLNQLSMGNTIERPSYDFTTHTRSSTLTPLKPASVIVVEGILVLASKELLPFFDLKIFVDTDADVRFIRRLTRDIHQRNRTLENVVDQYLSTVRPMHLEFVEPSKRVADIIIPEGGHNTQALDLLNARIKEIVASAT